MRLFAERGFAGTPIVRIEEAAGLAPSSGAFYRHFRSKNELLEAAVEDAAASSAFGLDQLKSFANLPIEDQVTLFARGTWLVFDAHRDLVLVLTRDTHPRPSNYGHEPGMFPGSGPDFLAEWLRAQVAAGTLAPIDDPAATALVLLDALTNYWLQREGESPTPYGIDSDRFINAWVALVLRLR